MKKTVFPLVMAALAAFPVLFSCTEKEQEISVDNHRFEYRFSLAEDATRALLNDEGVFWEAGDNVGLFTGAAQSLEAEVDAESSPKTIVVQTADPLAEGTTVYAYYPYVEGNTDVTASKVVFPAEQSGGALSAMPLAGIPTAVHLNSESSTIGVIRFLNLGSIIDFRVYSSTYAGETVESVALQANTGNLAGTAAIDLTDVSWNETDETATIPALTWAEGAGSSTVTLTQSAPVATDKNAAIAGGHLYMVVAPGTYSGTITVTTNAARYTFPFTNKELVLNGLKRFNMNLDNATEREGFSKTYVYAESISEGTYVIGGSESSGELSVALFPTVESKSWTSSQGSVSGAVVPHKVLEGLSNTATTITTEDADIIGAEVTLSASGNSWKIKINKTGEYLVAPSSNYVIDFTTDESEAASFTVSSNSIRSGSYYFYHSGSAKGFTFRNQNTTNLRFYKLDGRSLSQTLAFSETEFAYDLASGEPFVEPTLTGAKTTVIYGTSNPDIAAVDAISGEVTFNENHRTGTVTITATAAGMDGYASAEASYTITVTDSNKPVVTYYKASVLESGYEYLIVSGGHALKNDNGALGDEVVTVSDNTIALAEDTGLLWMATAVSGNNYGTHSLVNNGKFITRNSSKVVLGDEPESKNHVVWRYDGAYLWNGNSTNYYLYYNNGWALSQTNIPSLTTELFTARPPQTLNFSSATAEYDLYSNAWTIAVPTLSGAETTVTYGSSDETVATVDADGTVHPLSVGTTTITATAAGSAEYQGASATYTLTVTNSDPNKLYYNKITSLEDIEDEATYLIVYEDGNMAFKPVLNGSNFVSGDAQNAVSVTIESGKIEAKEKVKPCQIVLKKDSGSNYYIMVPQAEGSYLYLVPTRSSSGWNNYTYSFAAQSSPVSTTFSLNNSLFTISANNSNFNVNSGKTFFRANSSSTPLALYMLEDPRAEQDLAFGAEEAEYDLGTSTWTKAVPTLTGTPQGDVTYSSSDESVATVTDAGVVTPLKKGTTTITAHASGNDSYKPASASYELNIVNSNLPKYVKADQWEDGEEYLIVSNGYLLRNNSTTATAVAVEVVSGQILYEPEATDLWKATSSGTSFTLTNSGNTLRRNNSNLSIGNASSTASNNEWTYNAADEHLMVAGSYYFYYSTGNSRFSISTSASDTHVAALYVLDDGQPKAQHLAFSDETVTVNIYGKETPVALTDAPTLSGAKTTVSWNSSNQNVAEVDGDGIVTVKAVGTTTITATAAAEGRYLSGTASFVLTVTNEAPPTYTKVTSITSGATYLIVSADAGNYNNADGTKAFVGDQDGTAATVNNAAGVITGDYSDYEFVISASGSDYTLHGLNGYVTGNANSGSRYIQVSSTAGTMSLSMASDFTGTDGQVADAFYFYYSKTQGTSTSKEVLYFNKDGAFKVGGTGRKYGVYLYKKN